MLLYGEDVQQDWLKWVCPQRYEASTYMDVNEQGLWLLYF